MPVPFLDLRQQYEGLQAEVLAAADRVFSSTQFVLGKEVEAFEEEFAAYSGTRYAVAVNSGTSALHLALLSCGVGPGDEVITTPFTFIATAAAIRYTGARPVFVDIDPVTYSIDPALVEAAITPATKAILPVHLYGHPADMDPLADIARRHGLVLIEDAAQAHGAEYKARRCGSLGELGCFSFYPGKNLGAYGEGGLVTTSNPELVRTIRMLRDWGAEKRYHHVLHGFNYRMEGLQGAVLRIKLRRLEEWTEARIAHAKQYRKALAQSGLQLPPDTADVRSVYHIFSVMTDDRPALMASLAERGIQTGIHYPFPVHLQPAYEYLQGKPGDYPHAERAAASEVSLPMFPELTAAQRDEVVESVLEFQHACQC